METATKAKTTWTIDPSHSEIGFKVKHLMISNVRGHFNDFEGSITSDGNDFSKAEVEVSIKSASIDTRDEKRDGHLRAEDFFDADNHPTITFSGKSVEGNSHKGAFTLQGDLTIKGVSKPVTLEAKFEGLMSDPWGNEKAVFQIEGKIQRKEWGLNWNAALEAGGVLVSDEVWINCEVQLARQAS